MHGACADGDEARVFPSGGARGSALNVHGVGIAIRTLNVERDAEVHERMTTLRT
jgi:hypothetical protein